ncbi:hypothetical protein PPERSA_08939 [Pseudocohnilembus persalinus]|uniref:Uncharacterized protein n=1 Tax=Pseudocohnilembus persalinus TaxID=266149 RepID=A0A0V0R2U7_PSEPJ|nr:hypothetical protein PPERSA_08939 [Pseudocohnilembus persalinus]|eukprot:KRX08835.1 hypothetical protein PPERSA_08939 [Pseudocohnilembus persalinus]
MMKQVLLILALIVLAQSCTMSDMFSCSKKFTKQLGQCDIEQGVLSCISNVKECQSCAQKFIQTMQTEDRLFEKVQEVQEEPVKLTDFGCSMKKGVCQGHCNSNTNSCYKACLKQAGC